MFYFVFLFIAALAANKWAQIEGACNNSLSNSWPVDCNLRAYLITPNFKNETILTNAINYAVYNTTTSNSTVWTLARRSSLNSYWNNIRTYIWDNTKYPTQSAKINKIIYDLTAYSSTDCPFKANNFYSIKLELGGCLWGTIGDFVGCGNSTANIAMPTSNSTTWPSICPPSVNTSTMPISTISSTPTMPTSTPSNNFSSGSSNSSCKIVTSSNWPVDCAQRGNLLMIDSSNKTIFTKIVFDTVYNVNTSNSTTWTTGRKFSFNSYWNSMRNIIWNNSTTMSTKINQLFNLLINYSAQDCVWQEYFFSTTLEFSEGCEWGSIGDFMACGNVSANFTMPSSTMAPICSVVTQSPNEASTVSSGSNNGGADSSTSSSGGSSGSSNSSCKIATSSNWPADVDCAQRGNLLLIDSSNQTIMTKNVFNTVYNVNTSNSSVWTTARKFSFNSFWNSMRNIIWNNSTSMSTKINQFYNLMVSYSAQDCDWQAKFFSTSIVYGDNCKWGSIGDFLACGNASTDYSVPTTTDSTICPYGGISLNEENGGSGQTVIVTENGGGNGFTESINFSLVTGFVNESFSGQTIEFNTVTFPSINVSDSTASTGLFNVTLFEMINSTVSMPSNDPTISSSTDSVTISKSTDIYSTESSSTSNSTFSPITESTPHFESSLSPIMPNVTALPNDTMSSTMNP